MDSNEFEILMDWCKKRVDDNGCVSFTPYLKKDRAVVIDIIERNDLINVSPGQLQEIAKEQFPMYQARKKVQQKKLEEYSKLSPDELAKLSMNEKLNYLELLLPRNVNYKELKDICANNEEKIKACMFNMNFPQSFWNREKGQADRYVALIANSPNIMNSIKNWDKVSLDDKKQVVLKSAEIFKYIYGDAPKIRFFTPEEEIRKYKEEGRSEIPHISAAYAEGDTINFNIEALQNEDNFFAVSVVFHEGTHYRQDTQSFNDPMVDRMFRAPLEFLNVYEFNAADSNSSTFGDFYTQQPTEIHAYGLQEYVENSLIERTGVQKKQTMTLDKEKQNMRNKAFTRAKIAQYRS